MKRLLLAIAIVIVLLALYAFFKPEKKAPEMQGVNEPGESFAPELSNAAFSFEGKEIKLSDGKATYKDEAGFTEYFTMLEQRASGDLNSDGKSDRVALVGRTAGASGFFVYAVAYISGPVGYKGTNAVFVGDRVSPQSISVSEGVITVEYLDRMDNEPFAATPTVPTSKEIVYRNGELEER